MLLGDGGRPFVLRDYQRACVDVAAERNVLCALPVGSGKTVIAAEVIHAVLRMENEKKVVFLAPYGMLAKQQLLLLMDRIDRLHLGTDITAKPDASPVELARWRAGLAVGQSVDDDQLRTSWRKGFDENQLLVMTPAQFEKALSHACISMADIALLVIDEVRPRSHACTIMPHARARACGA